MPLPSVGAKHAITAEVGVFLGGLFFTCLFAHGELAELKPVPRYLTTYYLTIALGGAFGSVLVGIVAPLVLSAYFELPIARVCGALLMYSRVRTLRALYGWLAVAAIIASVVSATATVRATYLNTILLTRNFYGALRVQEADGAADGRYRTLIDGVTIHRMQFLAPRLRRSPTTYYTRTSGVGRLLTLLNRNEEPLRVGIIGLGAGTLAAYGRHGDTYRFYEINLHVALIARREFTYLRDSAASIEMAFGDARINLEREAPQKFDLLVLDAFSSDAVPIHLLTSEAVALYRRHLNQGGVIAFHVSSRFLDLAPVVVAVSAANGMQSVGLFNPSGTEPGSQPNRWVMASDHPEILRSAVGPIAQPLGQPAAELLWTDDFSSLIRIFK